jgi:glucose-6-phosphate 1-epimerase
MSAELDELRSRFAIPGVVSIDPGAHGMPRVTVTAPAAEAHVYLHGAHVTHYRPRGGTPVLFLSNESHFAPDKPIRGGVPVIFPWFGPHPADPTKPAHGWARTRPWTLRNVTEGADRGGVGLTLSLGQIDGFALTCRVRVGPELRLELEVQNVGHAPLKFGEALHTYLAVSDVRQARVEGLDGRAYLDKVDGMKRKTQSGPVTITGETDRVYLDTPEEVTVHDPGAGRRLTVSKEGSASTVVWNPWVEKAKKLPDFGDDEWPRMLCVETANVAENAVTIAPGRRHVMRALVRVG